MALLFQTTVLGAINVAHLVKTAFRGKNNSVGPKMCGLKVEWPDLGELHTKYSEICIKIWTLCLKAGGSKSVVKSASMYNFSKGKFAHQKRGF